MDKQLALCTCLLLLGVVVNIECSGNSSANYTETTPANNFTITTDVYNSTSHLNTSTEPSTTPKSPEVNTGHTDFSSISPRPTAASSSPDNSSLGDEHITTRGTHTTNTVTSDQSPGATETTLTSTTVAPTQPQKMNKGYVVLVIIIIVAVIIVIVCFLKQKKRRRYSIDIRNKHEDAVIPLSTVEADAVFEATPEEVEMETFTAQESSVQETTPQPASPVSEPVVESEPDREEPISEGPKATELETSGSQEPLTTEKSEKMDVVDLNDGEPTASTKTSMESLEDQLNDNNSNNYHMRANGCVTIALDEEIVVAD